MRGPVAEWLRQQPAVAQMSRQDLRVADSLGTTITVEPGTALCVEGEVGREACLILSGTATVVRHGDAIASVGPAELVGERALLGAGLRSASVVADDEVTAVVLNRGEFMSLLALPGVEDAVQRLVDGRESLPRAS